MNKVAYEISTGWITRVNVGGMPEERYSDDPSTETFDNVDDARRAFNAINLKQIHRTEKMCAGRAWRDKSAYKELARVSWDECEIIDFTEWPEK